MEKRWWIYGPLGKGKILLEQKETFVHLYSSSSGECGQRLSDFHYIYFMDTIYEYFDASEEEDGSII